MSIGEKTREAIQQGVWNCSARIDAPENALDPDFQAGYLLGKMQEKRLPIWADDHPITVEWERRGKPSPKSKKFKTFMRWKAGYWAGCFAAIRLT